MMANKVAVLGCGPAGLVAAHAATLFDSDVDIFSKARKSQMFGAQYLHERIPDVPAGKPIQVEYLLDGEMDGYRRKVYGANYTGRVSPADYEGDHIAYDIRATYDHLWERYSHKIVDTMVSPAWLSELTGYHGDEYCAIFCTIPWPQMCTKQHEFASQEVWAMGDSDQQLVPIEVPGNTVVCSGDGATEWYRASNIFGYRTVEWPAATSPPLPGATKVNKPLSNNCDCWPTVTRLGRFGQWRKGVLVHHAFHDAVMVMGSIK
jgi:hypothetical protein